MVNQEISRGRTPTYLTGPELKEAMHFYLTSNPDEKQLILQKFGKKVKKALAICKLDVGKQGKISRHLCSFHGAEYLVYIGVVHLALEFVVSRLEAVHLTLTTINIYFKAQKTVLKTPPKCKNDSFSDTSCLTDSNQSN